MHGAEDLDYYPPVLLYMYNEALDCYKFFLVVFMHMVSQNMLVSPFLLLHW